MYKNLMKRLNGGYTFEKNGQPFTVSNDDGVPEDIKIEYAEVHAWALANLSKVVQEQEPNMPTIEEAKQYKIQELKNARDAQERAGFKYMGVTFDSDSVSFQRMLGADNAALKAQMQGVPFEINWTVQDNSSIHMTLEQTLGMVPTFAVYSGSLHEKCKLLVAQVEAATTVEGVQAITWE